MGSHMLARKVGGNSPAWFHCSTFCWYLLYMKDTKLRQIFTQVLDLGQDADYPSKKDFWTLLYGF